MGHESFGKYISAIYRHNQIIINQKLKPYGIGSGQYIFLVKIYGNEGISQKELSKLISIDKTTTAKAIKKLEEEGYIYRVKDPEDKRYYKLYLTQKGKDFMPTLHKTLRSTTTILTAGMDDRQHKETIEALKLMLKNVCEEVEELRNR